MVRVVGGKANVRAVDTDVVCATMILILITKGWNESPV